MHPLWRSPWPLRATWLVLPFVIGPTLADALADRSRSVQVVASAMAWIGWGGALGALAVLRTATLTAIRFLVPAALPLAVWAASGSDGPGWAAAGVGLCTFGRLRLWRWRV